MSVDPTGISLFTLHEAELSPAVGAALRTQFGSLYETAADGELNSDEHHAMARVSGRVWQVGAGPNCLADDAKVKRYLEDVARWLVGACSAFSPTAHQWLLSGTSSEPPPEILQQLYRAGQSSEASVVVTWQSETEHVIESLSVRLAGPGSHIQFTAIHDGAPALPLAVADLGARMRDAYARYVGGVSRE